MRDHRHRQEAAHLEVARLHAVGHQGGIARVLADIAAAQRTLPLHHQAEDLGRRRRPDLLEMLARGARQRVQAHAFALAVGIVEEGAVARAAQLRAGVGDRLRQRCQVERRGQHLAGAIHRLEHPRLVAQGFLEARAAHHFARVARHVLSHRRFLLGPVARGRLVQVEHGRQARFLDDRHDHHRARADAGIRRGARRRAGVGRDVVDAHGAALAQHGGDLGPEIVQHMRHAAQAGHAAVGPVAVDVHGAAGGIDLAIADARRAQGLPGHGAGGLDDVDGVVQAFEGLAQLLVKSVAVLGQYVGRGLGEHAIDAGHLPRMANRRQRDGKETPLALAVALELHQGVLQLGRFAGQHEVEIRTHALPQLGPDAGVRRAMRARVLVAQQVGIGVVVEQAQVVAHGQEHRKARCQDQVEDGAQAFGPGVWLQLRRLGLRWIGLRRLSQRQAADGRRRETAQIAHQDCPVWFSRSWLGLIHWNVSPHVLIAPPPTFSYCRRL